MKLHLLLIFTLIQACTTTMVSEKHGGTYSEKNIGKYAVVRKPFVFIAGDVAGVCNYERSDHSTVKFYNRTTPPPGFKENKLVIAVGEATCKDRTVEHTFKLKRKYEHRFLGFHVGDSNEDEKHVKIEPRYDGMGSAHLAQIKQPREGEITFEVNGETQTVEFENTFEQLKDEFNSKPEYVTTTIDFPDLVRDELNAMLKDGKEDQDLEVKIHYKTFTTSYLFSPWLIKTKCPSLIEGEPDSEENC